MLLQGSVQNNNLEAVQVNSEKHICSEDSAQVICSKVSAQAICSEDSAQPTCSEDSAQKLDKVPCHGNLHTKTDMKSKKHVAYSTAHLLFASKQPLLAALKLKKRKHRRAKIRSIDNGSIPDDQQTSTSETVLTKDISCKSHRRPKRSHASASSNAVDKMNSKKPHLAEHSSSAADLPMGMKDDRDATPASAELPSSCVSSVPDQTDSKDCAHPNERVSRHFDLLTRGLREITGKQPERSVCSSYLYSAVSTKYSHLIKFVSQFHYGMTLTCQIQGQRSFRMGGPTVLAMCQINGKSANNN